MTTCPPVKSVVTIPQKYDGLAYRVHMMTSGKVACVCYEHGHNYGYGYRPGTKVYPAVNALPVWLQETLTFAGLAKGSMDEYPTGYGAVMKVATLSDKSVVVHIHPPWPET